MGALQRHFDTLLGIITEPVLIAAKVCVIVVDGAVMLRYKVVLDSDEEQYNGHKRIDPSVLYASIADPWDNRRHHMRVRKVRHALLYSVT